MWNPPLPARSKLIGRGVLTPEWAFVPTDKGVIGVRLTDGERESMLEWGQRESSKELREREAKKEMGDLVVGGGRIYSVGVRYAHAYNAEEE